MSQADSLYEAITAEEAGEYEKAYTLFQGLAVAGDDYAMSALARFFSQGIFVECDMERSIAWDKEAISAGSIISMFNLAVTYRQLGEIRQARDWFKTALMNGHIPAALQLAKLYMVSEQESERVISYLERVVASHAGVDVSEDDMEEAESLLNEIQKIVRDAIHSEDEKLGGA